MITISKQLLEEAGFNCWKENPVEEPHICRKWQKCIYNQDGSKRYFIDINETFGWNRLDGQTDESLHNFWPSIQFDVEIPGSKYESHSIEISLVQWFNESGRYSEITIPVMEQMIEHFFIHLNGKNYEDRKSVV
jgi:hypothetical protein